MPMPPISEREYALEKRRRIRDGVLFYLYEKKVCYPDLEFSDDIIKYYVKKYKITVASRMMHEHKRADKLTLPKKVTHKKREVPWKIEEPFVHKKGFIWELTDIPIPD